MSIQVLETHKVLDIGTVVHRDTIDAVLLVNITGDFARRKSLFYSAELEGTDMWTGTYHESGKQFKRRVFWLDDDVVILMMILSSFRKGRRVTKKKCGEVQKNARVRPSTI